MKYLYIIILFLVISCSKKAGVDSLCPCEYERARREYADFSKKETILFYDSISNTTRWTLQQADINWMVYYTEYDSTVCYSEQGFNYCLVCNLPEDLKNRNIGKDGLSLICSGEAYQPCNPPTSDVLDHAHFDIHLTILKY